MRKRILHITDFHIADPSDPTEPLRKAFYDEYLRPLPECFEQAGANCELDLVVATGDFVDCGKMEHMSYAQDVLGFLANQFDIDQDRILTCIGNHDVNRALEEVGEEEQAREAYSRFAEPLLCGSLEKFGTIAVAGHDGNGLAYLVLDATRGGIGEPGRLDHTETDELIVWVKKLAEAEDEQTLVVCSHFPVDLWSGQLGEFDDPAGDWHSRHIWSEAAPLRDRIVANAPRKTVWLAGDIHREADFCDESVVFCTTGRLGVSTRQSHGEIRRQVTLLEVHVEEETRAWRAEFRLEGKGAAHKGEWTGRELKFPRLARPSPRLPRRSPATRNAVASVVTGEKGRRTVKLVDQKYESALIRQIAEDGLYRFGRFETNRRGWVSLGWVNVEGLCALNAQVEGIIRRMGGWIRDRISSQEGIAPSQVMLIGLDCWGTVLGSQLSVKLGMKFLPVASRAEGIFGSLGELVDDEMVEALTSMSVVVLVTDVVGSGASLLWFVERAKARLSELGKKELRWFGVSIICDQDQERGDLLAELEDLSTLCANLRMPLVREELLPPKDVLPAGVAFHQSVGDMGAGDNGRQQD